MAASKQERRLIDFAREMRKAPMPNERRLWNVVRNRRLGGWKFKRQIPIGPYIVDFVCEEAKVELDGCSHDDKVSYDAVRKAFLTDLGYFVVRIGSEVFVSDGDDIPGLIFEACERRR